MKKLSILLFTVFAFVACDLDDHNVALNRTVENFIEERYEGANILQAESEGLGTIEVEFIHDGRKKTAYFEKRSNDWIYTTWDVTIGEVPDAVKDFEGLLATAGISYKKADLQGNYAPVISVLGVNFDISADGAAAQEQITNAVKAALAE